MLYYPKNHSTNLTRDTSSRRQFYEKVGDQSLVHNIDSWIVVPVSPVVEVCCVLTTLVKRVSSLIAREKTEEREAVLKEVRVVSRRLSRLPISQQCLNRDSPTRPGVLLNITNRGKSRPTIITQTTSTQWTCVIQTVCIGSVISNICLPDYLRQKTANPNKATEVERSGVTSGSRASLVQQQQHSD